MSIPHTKNWIKGSAQPPPDTKATGMSRFIFTIDTNLHCACGTVELMCLIIHRFGSRIECCIWCKERGGNEIANQWLLSAHHPVMRYSCRICGDHIWIDQQEVSMPAEQLLTSVKAGLFALRNCTREQCSTIPIHLGEPPVPVGTRVVVDGSWPNGDFRMRCRRSGDEVHSDLGESCAIVSTRCDSSVELVFQLTRRVAEQDVGEGACVVTFRAAAPSQCVGARFGWFSG